MPVRFGARCMTDSKVKPASMAAGGVLPSGRPAMIAGVKSTIDRG